MLVDSGARARAAPRSTTPGRQLTGEPGQALRSITGKGKRARGKRTLTGEVYDSSTAIPAQLDAAPAEARGGALSVAEMNGARRSFHVDPDRARTRKSSDGARDGPVKAEKVYDCQGLRRKVKAFLSPAKLKGANITEAVIGDVETPGDRGVKIKEDESSKGGDHR